MTDVGIYNTNNILLMRFTHTRTCTHIHAHTHKKEWSFFSKEKNVKFVGSRRKLPSNEETHTMDSAIPEISTIYFLDIE